jgi:thiamine-phosphate pyrophosphorylase
MPFVLPKLYPITDTQVSGLSHAEQVEKMIAGGAKLIQLREKKAQPDEFYAEALKAMEIARRTADVKIIINDRVDIALALKADGAHLGQEDMPPSEARKLLGNQAIIGFSTHNLEQVKEAMPQPVDYIAFGPVFPTLTKNDPDPVVGLKQLSEIMHMAQNVPVVAIGGINSENYRKVFEAGADSIALISAIVSNPDLITDRVKFFFNYS